MNEREPFDDRLAAAVRTLADGARTQVDAVEVAERTIGAGGRRRALGSRTVLPATVWLLILVALLLAAFAWGLSVGGGRRTAQVVVPPVATVTPAPAAPTPTPDPLRDAHVSGDPLVTVASPGETSQVGDETRVTGIVYDLQEDVDDPRVAGFGTLTLDTRGTASMSYGSGDIHLDGADGAWDGTCTSSSWDDGRSISLSCWLTGTGAYQGLSYYRHSLSSAGSSSFDGLILSAPPPSP
jgi:hypothetical protein